MIVYSRDEALSGGGESFYYWIEQYKKRLNPNLRVITWDLAGYGKLYLPEEKNNIYIGGYSHKILELLNYIEDANNVVKLIEGMVV